jgi:hypothetical protein
MTSDRGAQLKATSRMRVVKRVNLWVLLVVLVYVVIEGIFLSGLFFLEKFKNISFQPLPLSLNKTHKEILKKALMNKSEYIMFSPVLGWTVRPKGSDGLARANSQGIRADKEYPILPADGVVRVSAFGDSFTHSNDVKNEDTWVAKLNKMDSKLEVLNFGVGAYGLDQAFLRYKEDGVPFNSHIILIGFLSENLVRNVNVCRLFLYPTSNEPFAKPRFRVEKSQLSLLPNPMCALGDYEELLTNEPVVLSRLGAADYFYHRRYWKGRFDFLPSVRFFKIATYELSLRVGDNSLFLIDGSYNPFSEAFLVTTRIFDEFYHSALDKGSLPIVLLFPTIRDIQRFRANRTRIYVPLISYLEQRGYRLVDLLCAFDTYGRSEPVDNLIKKPFLHYSPLANEFVARYIADYLEKNQLNNLVGLRRELVSVKNSAAFGN